MYCHLKVPVESYCWLVGQTGSHHDGSLFLIHRQHGWRDELAASSSWQEFLGRCTRRFNTAGVHTVDLAKLQRLYHPEKPETPLDLILAIAALHVNPRAYGHEPLLNPDVRSDLLLMHAICSPSNAFFIRTNNAARYDAVGKLHIGEPPVPADSLLLDYAAEFMAVARENADTDSVIAMRRCADKLGPQPLALLLDGKRMPASKRARISRNTPATEVSS